MDVEVSVYKHILLPTDGSELSRKAITHGVGLAKALGAEVTGLHVIVDTGVAAGIGKALRHDEDLIAAAEAHLAVLAAEAKQAGVRHTLFHVRGDSAWERIVETATTRGCDLIVMASHGRRGLTGLLLGSETQHVLTHGKIPVLVYR